jgi:hypothetical protein
MEGEVITDIILGWREFTFTFLNLVGFYSSYTMYYNVIQYMQCNTGVSQVLINSCQGLFSTHLQVMQLPEVTLGGLVEVPKGALLRCCSGSEWPCPDRLM